MPSALSKDSVAHAQAPDASARTRAEAYFQEGRHLLDAGEIEKACVAFEASQELDGGSGTLLNLARCYELDKRIASAWATYAEAEALSHREGNSERADVAQGLRKKLEPLVVRVTFLVRGETPEGDVSVDGRKLSRTQLRLPLPLDAGKHSVRLETEGGSSEKQFEVPLLETSGSKRDLEVELPPPQESPSPAGASSAPVESSDKASASAPAPFEEKPPASQNGSGRRFVGTVLTVAGIAGAVTASFFVVDAYKRGREADCDEDDICSPQGKQERTAARRQLAFAYGAGGISLAALGGGITLLSLGGSSNPSASQVPPRSFVLGFRGQF